jgi:ribosomal protein S7
MKNYIYKEGIFKSKWLSKFINSLFFTGKRWKSENFAYDSFFALKFFFVINILFLFLEVLERLKPWVGLRLQHIMYNKKQKIQAYPITLNKGTQYTKAINWLIRSIQLRQETNFCTRISNEIKSIIFNELTNSIIKKKEYYKYAIMFKSKKNFKW